ncbi:MAG: hypothetical protein HOO06_04430 [Bdellovibrionaceae bacterium]|jgi:hypothetical protein|nr:hypothetical protein [Pseudobdellovibrionaceae bacterium]
MKFSLKGKEVILLGLVGFSLLTFSSCGSVFWWVKHSFSKPKDFYTPLVSDSDFDFSQKGFTKEYKILPKYRYDHEIALSFAKNTFHSNFRNGGKGYEFLGIFKVEIYLKKKLIREMLISEYNASYFQKGLSFYRTTSLKSKFSPPISWLRLVPILVKVTQLKVDKVLSKNNDKVKLVLRVSPYK